MTHFTYDRDDLTHAVYNRRFLWCDVEHYALKSLLGQRRITCVRCLVATLKHKNWMEASRESIARWVDVP